jgi:hypothetical protein
MPHRISSFFNVFRALKIPDESLGALFEVRWFFSPTKCDAIVEVSLVQDRPYVFKLFFGDDHFRRRL